MSTKQRRKTRAIRKMLSEWGVMRAMKRKAELQALDARLYMVEMRRAKGMA